MAPTADSAVFVDTNILIYSSFSGSALHTEARWRLLELESSGAILWASRQVLREFLAVATRPGNVTPAPSVETLSGFIGQFENSFQIGEEDALVTALLLELVQLQKVQGKQVHDANIVATMKRYQIRRLLTHNTADFLRYSPGIEVIPLHL